MGMVGRGLAGVPDSLRLYLLCTPEWHPLGVPLLVFPSEKQGMRFP